MCIYREMDKPTPVQYSLWSCYVDFVHFNSEQNC